MDTECLVCKDRLKRGTHKWFTPTPEQRRDDYFGKIKFTHSYCIKCFVLNCKAMDFSDKEIEEAVGSAFPKTEPREATEKPPQDTIGQQ